MKASVEKKFNPLLKIFPFPSYLRMSAVGIDISDRSVKYAEMESRGEEIELKNYGYKSITRGIVEKGEIKDKARLVEILKSLRRLLGNFYVIASLPEEKAFLKVLDLPLVKREKIRETLRLQIEEIVPFSSEDVVFDFDVLEESSEGLKVVLAAFPRKIAEDYAEVFKKAGFFPLFFEMESQSLFKALVGEEDKRAVMIIDFGKTRTSFVVGEDGFVKFSSTINVAGEHIDKILAKSLDTNVFEAEEIKRKNISLEGGKDGFLSKVLPVVSVIKDEAVRVSDYWRAHREEQDSEGNIEEVILCGGDSNIPGLAEYLTYYLKVNTVLGNPWINVNSFKNYVPEMERSLSLRYATAFGLGTRPFKQCFFYD